MLILWRQSCGHSHRGANGSSGSSSRGKPLLAHDTVGDTSKGWKSWSCCLDTWWLYTMRSRRSLFISNPLLCPMCWWDGWLSFWNSCLFPHIISRTNQIKWLFSPLTTYRYVLLQFTGHESQHTHCCFNDFQGIRKGSNKKSECRWIGFHAPNETNSQLKLRYFDMASDLGYPLQSTESHMTLVEKVEAILCSLPPPFFNPF